MGGSLWKRNGHLGVRRIRVGDRVQIQIRDEMQVTLGFAYESGLLRVRVRVRVRARVRVRVRVRVRGDGASGSWA